MELVDYTHPLIVPPLHLPRDRRSVTYYLRLDELPIGHPYHYLDWSLFRYPYWLEGGSAWMQARMIVQDLEMYIARHELEGDIVPIVGSNDPGFDEALAQGILALGYRCQVAEVTQKPVRGADVEEGEFNV